LSIGAETGWSCLSTAPDKKNKQKRKNVEDYGEKAQIYFTLSLFYLASFFCKIDLKLDIISFFRKIVESL
jgi:hypothetical protein